jgi:hypothetical protein
MKKLKIGDTIQFEDADDMIDTHTQLAVQGVETDFVYEKEGEKGYWLEVLKIK